MDMPLVWHKRMVLLEILNSATVPGPLRSMQLPPEAVISELLMLTDATVELTACGATMIPRRELSQKELLNVILLMTKVAAGARDRQVSNCSIVLLDTFAVSQPPLLMVIAPRPSTVPEGVKIAASLK